MAPVVVLTGASSGIGRAAALMFADRGARLVLAARRAHLLEDVAAECRRRGAPAVAVPVDVADAAAVEELGRRAVDAFGRIDVWVNNAGVGLKGTFEQTPPEVFLRVLEVNLLGMVHGARTALAQFRRQGAGVLINNTSLFSTMPWPHGNAYVTSKHAARGFSEALRQELLLHEDIHVCTILPAGVDTPMVGHAANYTGRRVPPAAPLLRPERVARVIVSCAEQPRPEVVIGWSGRLQQSLHAAVPRLTEQVVARLARRVLHASEAIPASAGNLFTPLDLEPPEGGRRVQARAALRRALLAATVPLAGAAIVWRRLRGRAES